MPLILEVLVIAVGIILMTNGAFMVVLVKSVDSGYFKEGIAFSLAGIFLFLVGVAFIAALFI